MIVATVVGDVACAPASGEVEMGTPAARGHRPGRGRGGAGPHGQGRDLRGGQPRAHRRPARHALQLRGDGRGRLGAGGRRVPGARRHRVDAWRWPASCRGSSTSSRAASARPASSGTGAVTDLLTKLAAGTPCPTTSTSSPSASRPSPTATAATCRCRSGWWWRASSRPSATRWREALAGRPRPERGFVVPKLVDLADGRASYDADQARKRPDWTYADAADANAGRARSD